MKIQSLGLASLFVAATCAMSCLTFSRPVVGQTNILGNCGDRSCSDLLKQLQTRWAKEVREAQAQCYKPRRLGLKVSTASVSKKIILICWGAKNRDGLIKGEQLTILPFPGEEQTFKSVLNTNAFDGTYAAYRLDRRIISKLYQNQEKYELACALKDGNLNLQILNTNLDGVSTKVDVECSYTHSVLWDNNGDGIEDFEMPGQLTGEVLDSIEVK